MSDLLAERYGGPRRARRMMLLVLVGVLVVAGLGWVAWAAWFHSNQPIRGRIVSFETVSPHEVRARVDLDVADPEKGTGTGTETTGTCLLRATAVDHSIVGELNVRVEEIDPDTDPWISIRTEREATTVELVRCSAD